jgi:hypothetical protein
MKQMLCGIHVALGAVLVIMAATPAGANARAETCAAALSPHQSLIYRTVRPDAAASADLTALIRSRVIALVQAGRLPHASAPDDAQMAARCLRLLQS